MEETHQYTRSGAAARAAVAVSFSTIGISYSARVTKDDEDTKHDSQRIGLCFDCLNAQKIQSDRGSTFYRCKLSDTDATFPKYPRLPVLRCIGYTKRLREESE